MATTTNLGLTILGADRRQPEVVIDANMQIIDAQLGGAPTLTFTGCRVYGSANQSINTATVTALSFNTERYDTDTMHDNSTNPTRITCKTAGTYSLKGMIGWAANATGWRACYLRINGSTYIAALRANSTGAVDANYFIISTDYVMAVNDYAELAVEQNSGGALNVIVNGNSSYEFAAHLIR